MRATASPADLLRERSAAAALGAWRLVPPVGLDIAWAGLCMCCAALMITDPASQLVPGAALWVSLAVRCAARPCPPARAAGLGAAAAMIGAVATGWDVAHRTAARAALADGPVLAVMFAVLIWSQWAHRRPARSDGRRAASRSRPRPPAPDVAGRPHRAGWPGWARPERWSRRARLAAAQRRFLEDTSHQLRAPITIALGHAELLAGQLSGNQGRRDIDVVVGELERLRRLSDRLLLIAASENPDFLRPEPVELDMLAADRLLRWRAAAPRHWTAGRLDPAVADADPERLGLALDALIENAVQHTADGGAITVSVTAEPAGRMAAISVSDTGDGIRAKDLSRIFERFATSGGATQGTGLGLALVRAIARGHGGEIRVRSAPGEGSQFDLLLPVRPGAAAGRIKWGTGDDDDA